MTNNALKYSKFVSLLHELIGDLYDLSIISTKESKEECLRILKQYVPMINDLAVLAIPGFRECEDSELNETLRTLKKHGYGRSVRMRYRGQTGLELNHLPPRYMNMVWRSYEDDENK